MQLPFIENFKVIHSGMHVIAVVSFILGEILNTLLERKICKVLHNSQFKWGYLKKYEIY